MCNCTILAAILTFLTIPYKYPKMQDGRGLGEEQLSHGGWVGRR